jgi:hypothetical protein
MVSKAKVMVALHLDGSFGVIGIDAHHTDVEVGDRKPTPLPLALR